MADLHLAGCIITDDHGRILLLHRNTPKRTQWEIPGGKVETDELADATAIRELKEELGVTISIVRKLGGRSFNEDDFELHYTWFLAKIDDGDLQIMEPHIHDSHQFWHPTELQAVMSELSPNLCNFLEELASERISLN